MDRGSRTVDISTGSGLSSAGGALLVIFFFTPWLTACGFTLSGKDLALGIDVGFGMTTAAAYPWLIAVPLVGLTVLLLFFLNLNQPPDVLRKRASLSLAIGCLALGVLVLAGMGFMAEVNNASYGMIQINVQYGYFGSLLAAALVVIGAASDRRTYTDSGVGIPPLSQPSRSQIANDAAQAVYSRATILIETGPLAGQTISIPSELYSIGRSSENDLQLLDPAVSRFHSRIRYAEGAWYIQDHNSAGGLYVNGRKIMATRLNSGDKVQVGSTKFTFRI